MSTETLDLDPSDIVSALRDSVETTVPPNDRLAAFSSAMSYWLQTSLADAEANATASTSAVEEEYHRPAENGMLRISEGYPRAVADAELGDPSPLLQFKTMYLASI